MRLYAKIVQCLGSFICKLRGHNFRNKHGYGDITCSRCGAPWRL